MIRVIHYYSAELLSTIMIFMVQILSRGSAQIQSNPFQTNWLLHNYHLNAFTYFQSVMNVYHCWCYLWPFWVLLCKPHFQNRTMITMIGETVTLAFTNAITSFYERHVVCALMYFPRCDAIPLCIDIGFPFSDYHLLLAYISWMHGGSNRMHCFNSNR